MNEENYSVRWQESHGNAPGYKERCVHEVPDWEETCLRCERAELMFGKISETTNFAELIERPEWRDIKRRIVRAVNSHDALLQGAKQFLDQIGEEQRNRGLTNYGEGFITCFDHLRKAVNQAEKWS